MHPCCMPILALAWLVPAPQDPDATDRQETKLADLRAYVEWLQEYEEGAVRLVRDMHIDLEAVALAESRIAALARWNDLTAAEHLLRAAMTDPTPPGSRSSADRIEFHAELMPWRVRAIAREHIAGMDAEGLDDWLIAMVHAKSLASPTASEERRRADAALQILGHRESGDAQAALLEATGRLPTKLRVRALDVLAAKAERSVVPYFVELLRDKEPTMRITAATALGKSLGPHTDETAHEEIPEDVAHQRDLVIAGLRKVLERDKVWQVRAAACHALCELRTKHAIPALIAGLEAELKRKKDPWAMDVRLHRALERLTDQSVPLGDAKFWQTFWSNEKDRFRLVAADAAAARPSTLGDRYEKFFTLDLTSERVLFVVDFSGSMQEEITLETDTTSARPGEKIQKAKLVVAELKKIVLSLPDSAIFNVIVFSDDVRVWRPDERGRPAAVELDDDARDDLLGNFLDSLAPQGPTNLHGALDRALGFDNPRLDDPRYNAVFDTIYVLSDGAPTYGKVIDKDEIRALVRGVNRIKQIAIHAITFGELNDVAFLRDLAEENGGRHIHVE